MNKKFQRFRKEFGDVDLAKYFNLSPSITLQHTIDETIHLRIRYKKVYRCPRLLLPVELVGEIQSYLTHTLELFLQIDFPMEYPFVGPLWTLLDVQHNLRADLYSYYRDKIEYHNQYNQLHWTPAITISSDILDVVRRVNHFDEIFDYL